MKRLRYAEAAWLLDDRTADALMERATQLARTQAAENLVVNVLDEQGQPEVVSFIVGPATMMTVESTESEFSEPENDEFHRHLSVRAEAQPIEPLAFIDDFE